MDERCLPDPAVPYLNISPRHDPFEPFDGSTGCLPIYTPPSVERHVNHVREPYGCNGEARRPKGFPKECETWNCETRFMSCVIDGGRYWPRGRPRGPELGACPNPPSTFAYTRTIWQFFDSISEEQRGED